MKTIIFESLYSYFLSSAHEQGSLSKLIYHYAKKNKILQSADIPHQYLAHELRDKLIKSLILGESIKSIPASMPTFILSLLPKTALKLVACSVTVICLYYLRLRLIMAIGVILKVNLNNEKIRCQCRFLMQSFCDFSRYSNLSQMPFLSRYFFIIKYFKLLNYTSQFTLNSLLTYQLGYKAYSLLRIFC